MGYDSRGNRWVSAYSGLPTVTAEVPQTSNWFGADNRISAWTYDNGGNVTSVAGMQRAFTYDAENRQNTAAINGQTTTYTYDGDGRRVQKTAPSGTTVYVYDPFGQLAQEYGPSTDSGTKYLHTDALGSTRLVTKADGTVDKNYDYLPFGEEIASGTAGRDATFPASSQYPHSPTGQSLEFTSKERDSETGLDWFATRYFSFAQGRFTSPDQPFAGQHADDPQSWNMYAYVRNNPLRYTDPDGRDCFEGLSSCGSYLMGGAKGVVNLLTSGALNAPTALANALSPLTGVHFSEPFQPLMTPANTDEREGMEAVTAVAAVSPVAEAASGAVVEAIGTATRVETGAAAAQETGTIYKLPAQESGKPYIGRAIDKDQRMATRRDGRTGPAEQIDTFNAQDRAHGQYKEQKAINAHGGIQNLDNKRNEVNPKRYQELKKKYEDQ